MHNFSRSFMRNTLTVDHANPYLRRTCFAETKTSLQTWPSQSPNFTKWCCKIHSDFIHGHVCLTLALVACSSSDSKFAIPITILVQRSTQTLLDLFRCISTPALWKDRHHVCHTLIQRGARQSKSLCRFAAADMGKPGKHTNFMFALAVYLENWSRYCVWFPPASLVLPNL